MITLDILYTHHIAIICSNYEVSKNYYTKILGFKIIREVYRVEKKSYKLDLAVNGNYQIELFSFPIPPMRSSMPEACGLRHMAFAVKDVEFTKVYLENLNVICQPICLDEYTNKKFFFISDPDNLPIEFYEV